jgi:hypothetical protein
MILAVPRIGATAKPIFKAHIKSLADFDDLVTSLQYQAARCNFDWVITDIAEILSQLSNPVTLRRVGIRAAHQPGVRAGDAVDQDGQLYCNTLFDLTIHMASSRTWGLLKYSLLAPTMFAGILDNRHQHAAQAMLRIKTLAQAVYRAESELKSDTHPEREVWFC